MVMKQGEAMKTCGQILRLDGVRLHQMSLFPERLAKQRGSLAFRAIYGLAQKASFGWEFEAIHPVEMILRTFTSTHSTRLSTQ